MNAPARLLIVEDNDADAFLIADTLGAALPDENGSPLPEGARFVATIMRNGAEACAFIEQTGPDGKVPAPDLVLLDINLPKLDGLAVLETIRRADPDRKIPVVMLTSSNMPSDVASSYRLGANCYVTKPVGLSEFQGTIAQIERFWFDVATLP